MNEIDDTTEDVGLVYVPADNQRDLNDAELAYWDRVNAERAQQAEYVDAAPEPPPQKEARSWRPTTLSDAAAAEACGKTPLQHETQCGPRPTFANEPAFVESTPDPPLPPENLWRKWPSVKIPTSIFNLKLTPEMLPPEPNLHSRYIRWAQDQTDSPPYFHWGAFTTALAAVMGPHWRLQIGNSYKPPILFTALVAQSGVRKSSALDCLIDVIPRELLQLNAIARSDVAVVEQIKKQEWQLLCLDEIGAFMQQLGTLHHQSTDCLLTMIFDGKPIETITKTQQQTQTKITNPFVYLLGATVLNKLFPKKSTDTIKDLLEGGLFGRILIVPGSQARIYDRGRLPNTSYRDWLRAKLQEMYLYKPSKPNQKYFKMDLTADAFEEFRIWQRQCRKPGHALLSGIFNRSGIFALKIAAIYHASQCLDPEQPINTETMLAALNVMHNYLLPAQEFVAAEATAGVFQTQVALLYEEIKKSPSGVTLSEIITRYGTPYHRNLLQALANRIRNTNWRDLSKERRGKAQNVITTLDRKIDRPNEICIKDPAPWPKRLQELIDEVDIQPGMETLIVENGVIRTVLN